MKGFIFILFLFCSSLGSVEDEVCVEKAYQHVEELVAYSPRLAGSGIVYDDVIGGSYSAALYIAETLREYGYHVYIQEFLFTTYQITECVLIVDFDGDFSTPDQLDLSDAVIPPTIRYADVSYDMVVPLVFLDETTDVAGTVPGFEYWVYYDPAFADTVGTTTISLVYKRNEPAFTSRFRDMFSISYEDYLAVREKKTADTVVWVKFVSHSEEVTGYNVIGVKPGDTNTKTVVVGAHYDSVYTDGAIDNGSGVAALLETARILSHRDTDATVYFVFFDAEEIGLLGSEAFVNVHDLDQCVCINVDSIASGDTVYVGGVPRYEELWGSYHYTDAHLDAYVAGIAEHILGYKPERWFLETTGGYSDFAAFTKKGIPATDITTLDKEAAKIPVVSEERLSEHASIWVKGERVVYYHEDRFSKIIPYIHTSHDDLAHFNKELFYDGTRVVVAATYQLSRTSAGEVSPVHVFFVGVIAVVVSVIWYLKKRCSCTVRARKTL